jgi:hypothetical protein
MENVAAVSAGDYQTFAIKTDGSLWIWGANSHGLLGDGTRTDKYTPEKVMGNVAVVSEDYDYAVAIKTDGSLWAWGSNSETNITSDVPIKILENVALGNSVAEKTLSTPSQENIKVLLNNKQITFDQPPIIKDGQTLVPLRAVFESMGATVKWDGGTQSVTVIKGDINVTMQVDYCIMSRNGKQINLDIPPQKINEKVYVPIQAAAVSLRADFDWDESTHTVYITNDWTGNADGKVSKYSYLKYEEKMKTYGFDILYNNKSAESSEAVTKAEALKLAIAAIFNINEVSQFVGEDNEYLNASWVDFAKYEEITKEDVNIHNYNEKAKYIDVISYFENCKVKYLKEQPIKDTEVNLKDLTTYSAEEQTAIKDMVANGIIDLLSDNLKGGDNIFKGQLNELVVNYAEKYNTIAMEGDKITFDPEKMPSNAGQYPYILPDVDKYIYEIPLVKDYAPSFLTAKELYVYAKELYPQVKTYTEEVFNSVLNIDYRTITEESLRQKLEPYFVWSPSGYSIRDYVKYVKDNEIIIEGKAKFQAPILYWTGLNYRPRVRLEFEIKHSKTKENVLFLDRYYSYKTIYEKTKYDVISDYYLATCMGVTDLFVNDRTIYPTLLNKEE